MEIYSILARDKNNLIGNKDALPWKDDDSTKWDLSSFKNLTGGNIVFMGYRTFLGFSKPLPGRINVVESREGKGQKDGFIFVRSLDDFLSAYKEELKTIWQAKKIFIIGGGKTLLKYLNRIDFLYLTTFYKPYEGDAFISERILKQFKRETIIEEHLNGKTELFLRKE